MADKDFSSWWYLQIIEHCDSNKKQNTTSLKSWPRLKYLRVVNSPQIYSSVGWWLKYQVLTPEWKEHDLTPES